MSKRGPICRDCYQLPNHCSLCGLPVREGDGHVKTGDGRFICRFDKATAVLDTEAARDIFAEVRADLSTSFGSVLALKNPEVTVNLFDVDYWSEKGREDGLHKYGFSSTRKNRDGSCTHEVVMLSGQFKDDLAATAAHEYAHLWINENLAPGRVIEGDTIEAICELTAYELMTLRQRPEQFRRIAANPYTHGAINTLLEVDHEHGFRYVLDWVREGTAPSFTTVPKPAALARPANVFTLISTNATPPPLPAALKLGGLVLNGSRRQAIINGQTFNLDETRTLPLRSGPVVVHCREIKSDSVIVEVAGASEPVILRIAP